MAKIQLQLTLPAHAQAVLSSSFYLSLALEPPRRSQESPEDLEHSFSSRGKQAQLITTAVNPDWVTQKTYYVQPRFPQWHVRLLTHETGGRCLWRYDPVGMQSMLAVFSVLDLRSEPSSTTQMVPLAGIKGAVASGRHIWAKVTSWFSP